MTTVVEKVTRECALAIDTKALNDARANLLTQVGTNAYSMSQETPGCGGCRRLATRGRRGLDRRRGGSRRAFCCRGFVGRLFLFLGLALLRNNYFRKLLSLPRGRCRLRGLGTRRSGRSRRLLSPSGLDRERYGNRY